MSDTFPFGPLIVIDDDTLCLASLEILLSSIGYDVRSFFYPLDAIEKCKSIEQETPLILTDYRFDHGISGQPAVLMIRTAFPNAALLILTGDTSPEAQRFAWQNGCRLLRKPAPPDDIIRGLSAIHPHSLPPIELQGVSGV